MVFRTLKEFIKERESYWEKEREKNIVAKYKVPSRSTKGDFHLVKIFKDGEMFCDCIGNSFGKECHHIKKVKNYLCQKDSKDFKKDIKD